MAGFIGIAAVLFLASRPLGGEPQPSFYVAGTAQAGIQVGQLAPGSAQASGATLPLSDLNGAPLALSDFAGRPIWLIFWKTACEPCEAEAPDVAAAYAAHQKDVLVVIGVDPWDGPQDVRDYVASHELTYRIAIDPSARFMSAYGVWGAPTHYFIDAAGRIQDRFFGPMTRVMIENSLARII